MEKLLIIGLGNPGTRFQNTRHNLGQRVVEALCEQNPEATWREDLDMYRTCKLPQATCLIPLTFMNDSGQAVASFLQAHRNDQFKLLIVHDDIELPFGEIKSVDDGSAKGHNGVRSIHATLGTTEIPRLRLGVGRPVDAMPVDEFVLAPFTGAEQEKLPAFIASAREHIAKLLPVV